jgi:predicted CXXCH cytochrome family protein
VYEVAYAFGNRRHQPYVVRDETGRHWVLPIYWNDVTRKWLWDGWRDYVTACAFCHVTGIRSKPVPPDVLQRYREGRLLSTDSPRDLLDMTNPPRFASRPPDEGWSEGAVGCEVCHGPGRKHVEAVARMGKDAYRAYLASGGAPTIYDPGKDQTPAGAKTRMSQCDSCHDFMSESSVTWVPTPTGYDHEMQRAPIRPDTHPTQFYPDGTDMSPCTVGRVFRDSRMGKKGVECADCHDSHGNSHWAELVLPVEDNRLCLKCHATGFPDVAAQTKHSRHAAGSPGNRCYECHMQRDKRFSNGVQVMSQQIPSHTFSVPTGNDRPGGPPNACIVCHTDRDAIWTRGVLKAWRDGTPPPK